MLGPIPSTIYEGEIKMKEEEEGARLGEQVFSLVIKATRKIDNEIDVYVEVEI